ncbi:hypothetical protein O988_06554 [Pseudogymnoascus sp. VKM F-3808]|nr:hypothetical protein O988_06554 [Pseudogymnoascus sp. VKM F-3808]
MSWSVRVRAELTDYPTLGSDALTARSQEPWPLILPPATLKIKVDPSAREDPGRPLHNWDGICLETQETAKTTENEERESKRATEGDQTHPYTGRDIPVT